jgi:hypothetical protein
MRPVWIGRTVLAVGILTWLATMGLGYLGIGNQGILFLVSIASVVAIILGALSCIIVQVTSLMRQRERRM